MPHQDAKQSKIRGIITEVKFEGVAGTTILPADLTDDAADTWITGLLQSLGNRSLGRPMVMQTSRHSKYSRPRQVL
jgi:hypothetical protein